MSVQINTYAYGEAVRLGMILTRANGSAIDPLTAVLKYRSQTVLASNATVLTYGTDDALVKDSDGRYYADVVPDRSGLWFYRFETTGPNSPDAGENRFYVNPSEF